MMANFDDLGKTADAISELRKISDSPASIEFVDGGLLELVDTINPNQLKGMFEKPYPKAVLIVEFDDAKEHQRKKNVKAAEKIFSKLAVACRTETDLEKQEEIRKAREAVATALAYQEGGQKAVPIIDDGVVPVDKIEEYFTKTYELLNQVHVRPIIWGHAGSGNFHIQPHLNLAEIGDRQKIFRLMDSYNHMLIELGGSTSGEFNDGRLRGPYLSEVYGPECYELFQKVKQIFDPHNTLNPGVKINVSLEDVKPLIRTEYTIAKFASHLPKS
jgi:FAD/FMN-containing dehydrogenase